MKKKQLADDMEDTLMIYMGMIPAASNLNTKQ